MRAIYEKPDGTLAVIIPAPNALESMTLEQIVAKDSPDGVDVVIVEDNEIPTDRTFRNAWRVDTSNAPENLRVDMPAAKLIAHIRRRLNRAALFAPLDVLATIPAEAVGAEIARQSIRDNDAVKQIAIDDAADVDALLVALGG